MKTASDFWTSFSTNAVAWCGLLHSGHSRAVFDSVDKLLEQFDLSYCFDLTTDDNKCYFILTPEGDLSIAKKLDDLVLAAPSIPGWKVFARRQQKSLEDVCVIIRQLYLVDVSGARFWVREEHSSSLVELYITSYDHLTSEEGQGLANTLLWHALGEENVMARGIRSRLIRSMPRQKASSLSLPELVQYFQAEEGGR